MVDDALSRWGGAQAACSCVEQHAFVCWSALCGVTELPWLTAGALCQLSCRVRAEGGDAASGRRDDISAPGGVVAGVLAGKGVRILPDGVDADRYLPKQRGIAPGLGAGPGPAAIPGTKALHVTCALDPRWIWHQ